MGTGVAFRRAPRHARVPPPVRRGGALAFRRYQSLAGEYYGVRWLPLYSLSNEHAYRAPSPESPNSEVEPLYPEGRMLAAGENPFRSRSPTADQSMLIEPAIYLNALLRDFQLAGGRIVIRDFASAGELAGLRED